MVSFLRDVDVGTLRHDAARLAALSLGTTFRANCPNETTIRLVKDKNAIAATVRYVHIGPARCDASGTSQVRPAKSKPACHAKLSDPRAIVLVEDLDSTVAFVGHMQVVT